MSRVFSWLFNRTVLAVLGLLLLALLIILVGPWISIRDWTPLATLTAQLVLIGLIVALWLAVRLWHWWRARSANAALLKEIAGGGAPAGAAGAAGGAAGTGPAGSGTEEVAELRQRFDAALATLKKTRIDAGTGGFGGRFGRRYLYEMPWYVFLGAPGSGKTTALVNSGLDFPLADKLGKAALRGVGGTRNCDWWFTNQAVLLDTAGRYTTQESNQAVDKAEWEGFLALLKKFRPRAPINGVLLTASVTDLLASDDEERVRQAAAIRRRLAELYDTLQVRFPVYVIVTKTDLLSGFNEFFERMTAGDRAQVWGFTFPFAPDGGPAASLAEAYRSEFALLQKRIDDALPDVLQAEPDVAHRALIYAFPQQFAGLRDVLGRFLDTLFAESKFAAPPLVRGVYFTSGTQEGTPIDRVLGSIQRRFGVASRVQAATAAQGTGKSYFLRTLLQQVVFGEAHLVSRNPARERRMRLLQIAGIATLAVALVGMSIAWSISYLNNRTYLAEISPKVSEIGKAVAALPRTADEDVLAIQPILDATRDLPDTTRFDADAPPLSYRFGLYQGRSVQTAADVLYARLLKDLLLPRLALRLGRLLETVPPDNLDATYVVLKAYLMLHEPEHYQPRFLADVIQADWSATLGPNLTKEAASSLAGHLQKLLGTQIQQSPFPPDAALIRAARERLARTPPAERLYGQVRATVAEGMAPGGFNLVKRVGPDAINVFARASGTPLDDGVPALFTREGYRAFQERLNDRRLLAQLDEPWVLGARDASVASKVTDLLDERILTELRTRYLTEYRTTWEKFLADLQLRPASSLDESIALLERLTAPDSPITRLIRAVAEETTLTETGKAAASLTDRMVDVGKESAGNLVQRALGSHPSLRPDSSSEQNRAGKIEARLVDAYFEPWRRLAAPPSGGQSAGDTLIQLLQAVLNEQIASRSDVQRGLPPVAGTETSARLRSTAAQLPVPLRGMFDGLARTTATQKDSALRSSVSAELDGPGSVGDFCRKTVAGRYPLVQGANQDVDREDFAALFGPAGKLDEFFKQRLAALTDRTTNPWTFRRGADAPPGPVFGNLISFQQAAVIRDTFFKSGGRTPQVRVEMKLTRIDPPATGAVLDVDGQAIKFEAAGPQTSARTVTWPGGGGSNRVTLRTEPAGDAGAVVADGHWALHRLFDRARITPGPTRDRFVADFNVGGRVVVFDVYVGAFNPFRLPELERFRCPGRA